MKNSYLRIIKWLKNNFFNLLVAVIILTGICFRLSFYGDIRNSIATNDSSSYYLQANIPLFSWEAFTSRRLPTYPIFFNIFEPDGGYQEPAAISYPAAPEMGTKNKEIQPDYTNVVVAQACLSIFAWVTLVLVLCRHLKTKMLRPISAFVILAFAFSPPLAEWDSILMSESLSFSLFTLLAALTLELLFRVSEEQRKPGILTKILFIIWALLVPTWAFTRDSNSNTLLVLVVIFAAFLIIPSIRRKLPLLWVAGLTVWLVFLAYWYSTTTFAANRWVWGWLDIYNDWVNGYPERIKFFQSWGMPVPWTDQWVHDSGSKAYLSFLLNNPRFMLNQFLGRLPDAFSENMQPYFYSSPTDLRTMVLTIGDVFHPLASVSFFFPLFSGLLILAAGIKNFISENKPWLFFVFWIISMIYGLYMASFFGDSAGIIRHTLGAVVYMRFMIWLLPVILAEIVSNKLTTKKTTG